MDKVVKSPTAPFCWNWTAAKNKYGYGTFQYGGPDGSRRGEKWSAPQVAYDLFCGGAPEGKVVRHTCDNPACVNPEHLLLGTHADNVADRVARNRSATGETHGRRTKPEGFLRAARARARKVTWKGREMTPRDVANATGIRLQLLISRLDRGWSIDRAVDEPVHDRGQEAAALTRATRAAVATA